MKTTAIYFSPTGTSKRGCVAIAGALQAGAEEIDVTIGKEAHKREFTKEDLVVFGAPVYGGRVFKGLKERLKEIKGQKTPCVITVTYGNRDYDDALLELADIAIAQGFLPIAGAALIGEHTFGRIQVGRPNEKDITEDIAFAQKILAKLQAKNITSLQLPGNRPYVHGEEGMRHVGFIPSTDENCTNCGLCAQECPEGAIDRGDYSKIDEIKCISCFRCIRICPVHAKKMDTEAYKNFAEDFTKKLENPRENQFFL